MKLRHLESHLQDVATFEEPKVALEQYVTSPHIAACMIHTAATQYEDISGKAIADLGCGCGVLSIASALMDATYCMAVDIDHDALQICQQNCEDFELDCCVDLINADVWELVECSFLKPKSADTVIMNPPFGTKNNKGMDVKFLEAASKIAKTSIYSLHKTTTRQHIMKKAKEFGLKADVVAELRYDLPATYKFHKVKSKDIEVDFFRFAVE